MARSGPDGRDLGDLTVVALVPAFQRADSVGATVRALRRIRRVDRIVVVDDGSTDTTTEAARAAGAEVLRLPANRGKGGAVAAGVAACPEADVFLLVDADVGESAGAAVLLLDGLLPGQADLVVGVLPGTGRKGGFGTVRRLAAAGIRRACGVELRAPLSGQRAVRARYLRHLERARRFGLEVAMTVDAVRAGARLREVPVPMTHRHTGRDLRGFLHRGLQGVDVAAALWPRLASLRLRVAAMVLAALLVTGTLTWSDGHQAAATVPGGGDADRVVLVGVPHLGLDDLDPLRLPTLTWLADHGALAATSVRTSSPAPSSAEAYAALGAGTGEHAWSGRGALGQQLTDAGMTTAVVGTSGAPDSGGQDTDEPNVGGQDTSGHDAGGPDVGGRDADRRVSRNPVGLAVADRSGAVGTSVDDPTGLLVADPAEPDGVRADVGRHVGATREALAEAELVAVDLGDTERVASHAEGAGPARPRALRRVDAYLDALLPHLDRDTLLLVVGVTPPTSEWALTPTIAYGSGVVPGTLHSTQTGRDGVVALTDVAPTILDWFDLTVPAGMAGQSLRFRAESPDLARLRRLDDRLPSPGDGDRPPARTWGWLQLLLHLTAVGLFARRLTGRVATALRLAVLGGGLVGWLAGDPAVVAAALVLAFAGPSVTLLALHHARGDPELLPPA